MGDTLFPVELPEIKNKGSVVTPNPPYKYDLRPGESIAERNARRRADLDRANWIRAHGEEKPSRDLYDWD